MNDEISILLRHCTCTYCTTLHHDFLRTTFELNFILLFRPGTGCLETLHTMFIGKSEFYERYTTGCLLGKGGNGQVYAGYRNIDHFPVAIKVVSKKRLVEGSINHKNVRVPIEVALLHKSRHVKGVIKLMEYTELPDCFVIIMERKVNSIKDDCKDLYDFITDQHRANGCVNEELAKKIFKQVVQTVIDLEKLNVLHGDIKDENILIDTQTNEIKLIDFGAGNKLFEEKSYHTYHGTRVYAPPEWIKHKSYTASGLNVWSLGVLLYDLITGDIPFKNDNATAAAKLSFPNHAIISDGAKDLIRSCLTLSFQSRINLTDILNHPWFGDHPWFGLSNEVYSNTKHQSIEILPSDFENSRDNSKSLSQQPKYTGKSQITSLAKHFNGPSSVTSLVILESQIETMVMHSCHKQPFFKKLLKLLTLPITFLLSGIRSGCIVADMV